jgi:RNA polymerase sigma-70 factor (ECF subfamily)
MVGREYSGRRRTLYVGAGAPNVRLTGPGHLVEPVSRPAPDEADHPKRGATIDPAVAFEQQMLPHLASALTLARYLLREAADAEDAVQEAYLQAVRHFGGFRGDNARAWLLTIVRRICYAWTDRERRGAWSTPEELEQVATPEDDPETSVVRREVQAQLARAVDDLPLPFREVIVMREIQQLSYKEIASVTGVPVGTVMSRLARARGRLQRVLEAQGIRE